MKAPFGSVRLTRNQKAALSDYVTSPAKQALIWEPGPIVVTDQLPALSDHKLNSRSKKLELSTICLTAQTLSLGISS